MFSTYREVWKIVKKSIQPMQIVAFSLSALIGVYVILFAVYAYLDFKEVVSKDASIFKKEFVILSKSVSVIQTLTSVPVGFSNKEISKLEKQEFCTEVAPFIPSRFHVFLYTDSEAIPLKTDLFFETVPDKYLNVDENWKWSSNDQTIPIIMPSNFLALYNFGYAPTQNMPQISESLIKQVLFNVRLSGNNKRQVFKGQVVGFSDRINTVLVPNDFLQWANLEFGYENKAQPSRVIVETKNIADSKIFEYVADNHFQINENSLINSKLSFYLKLTLSVVGLVGIVITLLAVWLLIFSFNLIIEKNKTKIQNLFYLGYTFSSILKPYNLISVCTNVIIVIIASICAYFSNEFIVNKVSQFLPIEHISIVLPFLASIALLVGILSVNYLSIRKVLKSAIS